MIRQILKTPMTYISFVIIICMGLYIYFDKPSGYLQREYEREKLYKDSIEGIRAYYEGELTRKDSAAFQLFKRTQEAYNRKESELVIVKQQLRNERNNRRHFNNAVTDSLLSTVK